MASRSEAGSAYRIVLSAPVAASGRTPSIHPLRAETVWSYLHSETPTDPEISSNYFCCNLFSAYLAICRSDESKRCCTCASCAMQRQSKATHTRT